MLGIVLVVTAVFAFALSDVVGKYLAQFHSAPFILSIRYAINLALLFVFFYPRHQSALWQANRRVALIMRGLVLALASLTMILALRLLPVGETVAIVYLSPFLVMILSGPLLGERASSLAFVFAAIAFIGVLLIMRPGGALDPLGVTFALINAGFATAYHLMTRMLSRTETTISMLFYVSAVGLIFFLIALIGNLPNQMPSWFDMSLMASLGVLSFLGHYLFTAAYREAPAALLAPINYMHLVWAAGLGLLIFGHMPDALTLVGMAMILVTGILIAIFARTPGTRKPAIPES